MNKFEFSAFKLKSTDSKDISSKIAFLYLRSKCDVLSNIKHDADAAASP
jgi:hypothetical protein